MRVAVLWSGLSGYFNACLRELAARPGVDLMVAHEAAGEDAPFDDSQFSWMTSRIEYGSRPDCEALLQQISRFAPDVLLVSSWHIGEYRHILQHLQPRPLRVLCMDNQWHGTWKQRVGVLGSRRYVLPHYEAVFLPGERQACFARRLGFSDHQIWSGLYCPDTGSLSTVGPSSASEAPRSFGYLGRLSPEKGIQDLLQAYELYRESTSDGWALRVAGAGELGPEVDRHSTVIRSSFVQPAELSAWMGEIGCLVVPSRFEPWGVVVSEAAAAGVPIIATDACGSVPHLVHDFVNGRVARTGDVRSLAACMAYVASLTEDERLTMGQASRGLAGPYTPARWADTILSRSSEMLSTELLR